jgi:hypothetical protein
VNPRRRASGYPQLEAFLGGYLHQDFIEEHGDLAGAVAAFARDASVKERRALVRDWQTFRQEKQGTTLADMRADLSSLGAAWSPRRTADLAVLDRLIAALESR